MPSIYIGPTSVKFEVLLNVVKLNRNFFDCFELNNILWNRDQNTTYKMNIAGKKPGINCLLACLLCMFCIVYFGCSSSYKPTGDHIQKVDSLIDITVKLKEINPTPYLDSAYRTFKPGPGDLFRKLDAIRYFYHATRRNYDSAIVYADSMLIAVQPAFAAGRYAREYVNALLFKGDALLELERYDAAFTLFFEARNIITQKLADSIPVSGYFDRLSYGLFKQKNYTEAIKNYKLTIEYLSGEKNPFTRFVYTQMHLDDIGLCYNRLGMNDSALFYYNSALDYIKREQDKFKSNSLFAEIATAVIYGNMAKALTQMGNDSAAERYMKEGIRINSRPQHAPEDAEFTREKLARLYLKNGRTEDARQVLAEIKAWVTNNKSETHARTYYRLQATLDGQKGAFENAFKNINSYLLIDDSLDARQKPGASENIQKQLDFMERTEQLALSRAEGEREKLITLILVTGFITSVVITLLILRNYRQSRKNVSRLLELNNQVRLKNTQMHRALGALEKSQLENTRMMKLIAHDLRNPVGAMLTFTEMQINNPVDGEERNKMLALLRRSSADALNLIEELLESNAGAEEMVKESIELDAILQYCVDQLQPKAAEKKQVVILYPKSIVLTADREKLWRVFSNIITNAIKFSPRGAAITVKMKVENNSALVTITDQGIGIPAWMKDKVFDLNENIKRKGTANESSFGLGLFISRQIVEAHGGKIWFESPPTGGTVFYVRLPLHEA